MDYGYFWLCGLAQFLTRPLWGYDSEKKHVRYAHTNTCTRAHTNTQMHTVIMHTHLIHTSHPSPHTHPLLLTHSYTHREAAYALGFSLCLKGEGNCCGSQATERQPSLWLIGISGQKSVVYTVQQLHNSLQL